MAQHRRAGAVRGGGRRRGMYDLARETDLVTGPAVAPRATDLVVWWRTVAERSSDLLGMHAT